MNRARRVLESPLLLLVLVALTGTLGAAWYRADAAQRAPELPGYDWRAHPNALLIVVPSNDCGCGAKPTSLIKEAMQHHMDVVVVSPNLNKPTKEASEMGLSSEHLTVLTQVAPGIIKRFAPSRGITMARVRNGRITYQAEGNLPEDFFDNGVGEGHVGKEDAA